VIEAIVAGCQGDDQAREKVRELFTVWKEQDPGCVDAIEAIWNGERDIPTLTAGVLDEGAAIILAILTRLQGGNPYPPEEEDRSRPSPTELEAELLGHFRPVIEGVVAAAGGDMDARDRVAQVFPEWRKQDAACVEAVEAIIAGEREEAPLTAAARPQGAVILRAILARLRGEDPYPPEARAPRDQTADILRHFRPIIEAVAAACQGDAEAKAHVDIMYEQLREGGWDIDDPIRRMVEGGDRDANALSEGLDPADAAIVHAILARLRGENPYPPAADEESASGPDSDDEAITLGQMLDQVEAACRPEASPETVLQIRNLTEAMSKTPGLPDHIHRLGAVLLSIVEGERNPDLSGLGEELTGEIREMLDRIG
jgi:hypothetical protein